MVSSHRSGAWLIAVVPSLLAYSEPLRADVISIGGQKYDVKKAENKVLTLDGKAVEQPDLVTRALQAQDTLDQIKGMQGSALSLELVGIEADVQEWVMKHPGIVDSGLTMPAQLLKTALSGGSLADVGQDTIKSAVHALEEQPELHLRILAGNYFHEVNARFDENRTLMKRVWGGEILSAEQAERYVDNDRFMEVYARASKTLHDVAVNSKSLEKRWAEKFLKSSGVDVRFLEDIAAQATGDSKPDVYTLMLDQFGENVAKKRKEVDADRVHDRGELFARIGRYQESLPLLTQAVKLNPQNAEYWNDLGATFFQLGRLDDTLGALNRSLELNPAYGPALKNKSAYYSKLGDWPNALVWARTAILNLTSWPDRQQELIRFVKATESYLASSAKSRINP